MHVCRRLTGSRLSAATDPSGVRRFVWYSEALPGACWKKIWSGARRMWIANEAKQMLTFVQRKPSIAATHSIAQSMPHRLMVLSSASGAAMFSASRLRAWTTLVAAGTAGNRSDWHTLLAHKHWRRLLLSLAARQDLAPAAVQAIRAGGQPVGWATPPPSGGGWHG